MADRNSQIIICKNIKLDRNYNNVLNYTEAQMLSLCRANQVASASNYSFIRERGTIKTHFPYAQCLQSNYIAFQNPDYSNKWFFAWIDNVDYKSDGCGELSFTIDEWSTWFNKVNIADCFVVREHVNDDTIGFNTIPENLDVSDVIAERVGEYLPQDDTSLYYIVESTYNPKTRQDFKGVSHYNGNLSGSELYCFKGSEPIGRVSNFLDIINQDSKISSVKNLYILPAFLIDLMGVNQQTFTRDNVNYSYYELIQNDSSNKITVEQQVVKSFNNLNIKNNKCFCYPYNYLLVSNNVGNQIIYKYEDFTQEHDEFLGDIINFDIEMAVSVGGSIRLVPLNHKGIAKNYDESLPLGKFPTCSWASDAFTNWLTQNAVNIGTSIVSTVAGIGISAATGGVGAVAGVGMAISGATNIANIIGQFREASLKPSITGGNNTADVNFSSQKNTFSVYSMRVKNEYIKIIDEYFTKFGYKINRVKQPNISGRTVFNYVEIEASADIGYGEVPSKAMETINNACRSGVTIWHNHANIGNYSLNNSIVQ